MIHAILLNSSIVLKFKRIEWRYVPKSCIMPRKQYPDKTQPLSRVPNHQ
jgi:hypothetical protein